MNRLTDKELELLDDILQFSIHMEFVDFERYDALESNGEIDYDDMIERTEDDINKIRRKLHAYEHERKNPHEFE